MKKMVLAILMSMLLVLTVPISTLAKPQRTVVAELSLTAAGRVDLPPSPGYNYSAKVKYAGKVTDAVRNNKDWEQLEGAKVLAEETVNYLVDASGNILLGRATGTIAIVTDGDDRDERDGRGGKVDRDGKGDRQDWDDRNALVIISFESTISGNLFIQASDVGTWKVTKATESLRILKDATGTWTATVDMSTFTGTAHVEGNF